MGMERGPSTVNQQWPSLGSKREAEGQELQLQYLSSPPASVRLCKEPPRGLPLGNLSQASQSHSDLSSIPPELTPDP